MKSLTLAGVLVKAGMLVGMAALTGMGLAVLGFGGDNPGAGYGWWVNEPQDAPGANVPPLVGRLPATFTLVVEQEASGNPTGAEGTYTMTSALDRKWHGKIGGMEAIVQQSGNTYLLLFQLPGASGEDYWGGNIVLGASYSGRVMFWRVNGHGGIVKCVAKY